MMNSIWVLTANTNQNKFRNALAEHYGLSFFKTDTDLIQTITKNTPTMCFIDIEMLSPDSISILKKENTNIIICSKKENENLIDICFELTPAGIILGDYSEKFLSLKAECIIQLQAKKTTENVVLTGLSQSLTPKEKKILSLFFECSNRSATKENINMKLWPDTIVVSKTIEVHISNIRKKLRPLGYDILNYGDQGLKLELRPKSPEIRA